MNLARIAFRDGDARCIFAHAQRVLHLAGDNLRLRSGGVHMLAWAEYTAGNVAAAIGYFEKNVELYRQAGDPGDDLTPRARQRAIEALGTEVSNTVLGRGRSYSFKDAVALVRHAL